MQETLLVLTTCGSAEAAAMLAEHLVERRLAACVNTLAGVTSTYRWHDKVEQTAETLLLIKTTAARYHELETAIRERAAYELPEIVAVPIIGGLDRYLEWIEAATE